MICLRSSRRLRTILGESSHRAILQRAVLHFVSTLWRVQIMRTLYACALVALVALVLSSSRASAQNLLANPGFEDPITFEGMTFIGSWEGFSGGAGASAANSTNGPRTGAMDLDLNIANVDNTFAGVFQDVPVAAGQAFTLIGWNRSPSNPLDLTAEVRIEWRNSASNTEVGRTPNLNPVPGVAYSQFSLNGTAPAGADLARVVYAIQTFTGGPTNNGEIFVDDMSLTTVPEPGTAMVLGLGALGALHRRRRA